MGHRLYTFLFFLFFSATVYAQKIKLQVFPADAGIYLIHSGDSETLLGTGQAEIRVEKNEPTKVVFRKAGFAPVTRSYERIKGVSLKKEDHIELSERMVTVNAEPFDAKIYANGIEVGSKKAMINIPEGNSVSVEVARPGFAKKTRVYQNQVGADVPPVEDFFVLEDRLLKVKMSPDEVQIYVDGKKLPEHSDEIVIPRNHTVNVEFRKAGYVPLERSYTNKEGMPETPLFENISLKDRVVKIKTTPNDAVIRVDGRKVGTGEYEISIPEGNCVEVTVEKTGFASVVKNLCNQPNATALPLNDAIVLQTDEAYAASATSDQANINFNLNPGPTHKPDDIWKIINQVITNYFDVIEMSDKETSYVRTAWAVQNFPNNTIRTRIIVKPGIAGVSQYVVKIQSEASGLANTPAKDDEKFREWDRLLNTYKETINEMQAALQ